MNRAHKIELRLNNKERTLLNKHFGSARLAWNACVAEWDRAYKSGEHPSWVSIQRWWNANKYTKYPFIKELNAHATSCMVTRKLGTAFKAFFTGKAKHPKFHAKKAGRDSFSLIGAEIKYAAGEKRVYLTKIGWLRMTEAVRFEYSKIYNVTVSKRADRYFVSFSLEVEDRRSVENQDAVVGIDLGVKETATCSDGMVIENPRISNRFAAQVRRYNKRLARRKEGSKRWRRTVYDLRRLYYRIACIRNDYIHKFTSAVSKKYGIVALEDLNVKGMTKNHKLARSILDVSFFEIRRQFSYKARELRLVGRYEPSSKTCSSCGHVKGDLTLADRIYACGECGLEIDRDLNAAINISRWGTPVVDVDKKALVGGAAQAAAQTKLCLDEASSRQRAAKQLA
jgi:putative transposase